MMDQSFQRDIENVSKIPLVNTILDVICQTTGMGFATIARVTDDTWLACLVRDDIAFGLKAGGELKIETTICNEIRQSGDPVIINHVYEDDKFKGHHTPMMYKFESYISIPIFRKNGDFFGTLCAIDPNPHDLNNPNIIGMFTLFADLISFHLDGLEKIQESESLFLNERAFNEELEIKIKERTLQLEEKNEALLKMNRDLQSFTYISSHDLQEPLRKIQIFVSVIAEKELENLSEIGQDYFKRLQNAADRMRALISDLLTYSRAEMDEKKFKVTDLKIIAEEVKEDLIEELQENNAIIEIGEMCEASVINFQIRQLLHNLISNSLKFTIIDKIPHIKIQSTIVNGIDLKFENSIKEIKYCHIQVSDNGIGFDSIYEEKIFEIFQRLHDRTEYAGTGIGLAIVKKIVENHHGFIFASGKLNFGATFDIYIPAS